MTVNEAGEPMPPGATSTSSFIVTPLSPALGAEIQLPGGVPPNLGDLWSRTADRQAVEKLLLDHQVRTLHTRAYTNANGFPDPRFLPRPPAQVLLFRNQAITPDTQLAIAQTFGQVTPHPLGSREDALAAEGIPEGVVVLENTKGRENEARNDMWHSDVSAVERPAAVNVLYAADYDLPPGLGDTLFANMERAYDALGTAQQEALQQMDSYFSTHLFENENPREKLKISTGTYHPTVRTHPVSCRDSLYLSPVFFEHFRGMSANESVPLLAELTTLSTTPGNTYRHRWATGDLIIFDNRNTMHYAVYDYDAGTNRTMHSARAQMSERPFSKHRDGGGVVAACA